MRPNVVVHTSETGFLLSDVRALRGIIDAVPHPIFVKDAESRFLIVNRAFCAMMGQTFNDLIGRDDYDFVPKEQADVFRAMDRRVLETGETNENEEHFTDGQGRLRRILTGKSRLLLSNGTPLLIGCITDITEFRHAETMIRQLAEHDYLTGLPNRRAFSDRMATAVESAARTSSVLVVLIVDLDRFKPINDLHGHGAGDTVLREIGRRLRQAVRETDTVARIGGDEFAVISEVPEPWQPATEAVAGRLLASIKGPISTPGGFVEISASIGMAVCPAHGTDSDTLLHAADVAMYAAKQERSGSYRLFQAATIHP